MEGARYIYMCLGVKNFYLTAALDYYEYMKIPLALFPEPGLWRHATRPITFSLVLNDFGVKYVGKEHADHLIGCLKKETYKLAKDWAGDLYYGILLRWDYAR